VAVGLFDAPPPDTVAEFVSELPAFDAIETVAVIVS